MFNRVTIIGLGLIGGSLGLAIKEKRIAREVIGVSRRKSTIKRALSIKAVDCATLDVKKGVKGADLIIFATPVLKIISIAKTISDVLEEGVIVTDAGSTKERIVKDIESILPDGISFIGSHPLAGSEKSGVQYADKDLFKGAWCILTKSPRTDPKALKKIEKFWRRLGMKVKVTSPKRHDKIVSALSHLPHAVSVALTNACRGKDLHLAAGGFKDTTRIASGSPELWKDIFVTNKKNILRDISTLEKELSKIKAALKNNDSARLLRLFNRAKDTRDIL